MTLTSATYFTLLWLESVSFTSQVYKTTLFSINYIALSCPVYRKSTIAAEFQRMLTRWSRAISQFGRVNSELGRQLCSLHCRDYSKVAAVAEPPADKLYNVNDQVNLNKMFWSKPHSLALAPDSQFRVEDPQYEGFKRAIFKLMLFYSKQSKSIRGANVIYRRVVHQVDRPAIYDVFSLEKTFKTTFSLLVIHMWLCLRRLKQEGKEGVELGQYLYEIYNHDVELRVSKAGKDNGMDLSHSQGSKKMEDKRPMLEYYGTKKCNVRERVVKSSKWQHQSHKEAIDNIEGSLGRIIAGLFRGTEIPTLTDVIRWASSIWKEAFGVNIFEMAGHIFLFEFSNKHMLEKILQGEWA
ncbi:hypothetical protein MTR67_027224 [Solanum verrucosum]|uniref:DUF1985 domain-containing protein n=1 Tax=Solanum verrucosum TaxID=315347 RepID=A0AAF0R0C1_SOLVR|nr:hypothetical protein MTR67_027224 [Solanum verrucosum]